MIEHAKECDVGPTLYYYRKKNDVLFFNSVYEVVGAEFRNHYKSFDKLSNSEKVRMDLSQCRVIVLDLTTAYRLGTGDLLVSSLIVPIPCLFFA
jgi:Calmodulin binding protein-like